MHRKDREVTEKSRLLEALDSCQFGFLAMAEAGRPYVVPMSFVRSGNCLFFHTGAVGTKLDFIAASPRVSFAAVPHAEYLKGKCDFSFLSVVVDGVARVILEKEEKTKAYKLLIAKFEGSPDAYPLNEKCVEGSCIICLEIWRIFGKENHGQIDTHNPNSK